MIILMVIILLQFFQLGIYASNFLKSEPEYAYKRYACKNVFI